MNIAVETGGRAKRLKVATNAAHERLDQRIMAADPFGTEARYGQFALVQHAFHRDIDALYDNALLARLLPDLLGRRRLHQISQDIADLGLASPVYASSPVFGGGLADIPTALGWLYVAEGSNLGAAFLLKEALKLGLSEDRGARHLAASPDGRGLHWRTFTAALDAIELSDPEEARVVAGAEAAFARVLDLVEDLLPVGRA
jgi:heme oxygenase